MDSARILLAGGGSETEAAVRAALDGAGMSLEFLHTATADDTLTELAMQPFQLCLVRAHSDSPAFALEICDETRQSGLRIPIIVLMDLTSRSAEDQFLAAGAYAAMPWDGSQDAMVRNMVRMTLKLRKVEANLRQSNDQLVQEMLTLQDERERAEAVNGQYVELAENYAIAKEELEKLNNEKNKFFSIIAHDLRSPFTALLGFTELLMTRSETFTPDQVKSFSTTIHDSATKVFKLLENLLEWSRLQMDRVEFAPRDFVTSEVIERTIDILGPVADKKAVDLAVEGGAEHVFADLHMVDAVIRNLVNNAIKFTPRDGSIRIVSKPDGADTVRIEVVDTGVGMTGDTCRKIFSLTDNISTTGTDGEPGTGLGVLLCKELVERNGGEIGVKSQPGQGTTMWFTLPAKSAGT
ncbi:MAG: HAMP domain-containing histidine kinase [Alphaproteobacteria bacterium]|nr:HAMP domain-containing histidine kinase [Alphaproteobacteria bacterium]